MLIKDLNNNFFIEKNFCNFVLNLIKMRTLMLFSSAIILSLTVLTISCTKIETSNNDAKSEVATVQKQSYSGVIIEYYKNGNKKYQTKYNNGKPSGKYLTWFKDGTKKAEGEYKDGQRVGLWKWYNEKGSVNFTVIYENSGIAGL